MQIKRKTNKSRRPLRKNPGYDPVPTPLSIFLDPMGCILAHIHELHYNFTRSLYFFTKHLFKLSLIRAIQFSIGVEVDR